MKGDTVLFDIAGNPDFLIFFSGEQGKTYNPKKPDPGTLLKGMDVRLNSYSLVYKTAGS